MLMPGRYPQRGWFNCSVVWTGHWTSSFDSNVQPRWTPIESKLTSQINSVNFLRGCAHSAFPVCGLISIRSNTQLEHPETLQDSELFGYDWIIFPILYLGRQEIASNFLESFSISKSESKIDIFVIFSNENVFNFLFPGCSGYQLCVLSLLNMSSAFKSCLLTFMFMFY